jgi:glycerophosphoryl diester phosphodiesterase
MASPTWLTARPVAHRGLHGNGLLENTTSAALAAIDKGFAIECDVQLTADGEAVVFHDFNLERLTVGSGRLDALTADALAALAYRASHDRIPTLAAFLDLIGGRVPVLVEIKSRFDGDLRLTQRVAEVLDGRTEPVAVMSFDNEIVETLVALSPDRVRGIVAEAEYHDHSPAKIDPARKTILAGLMHVERSKPNFIAWNVKNLPHPLPNLARHFGMPVLTWTVRTPEDRQKAAACADQMIFEGFVP